MFAAAMTPIIVALVTEGLKRPAETVKSVAPPAARRRGTHATSTPTSTRSPRRRPRTSRRCRQTTTQRTVQSSRGFRLTPRQWKLGLATGALAFVLAVAFVTASELIAGEKVGGTSNPTTFFGKRDRDSGGERRGRREAEGEGDARRPRGARRADATPDARRPSATARPRPTPATPVPTATPTPSAAPAPAPAPSRRRARRPCPDTIHRGWRRTASRPRASRAPPRSPAWPPTRAPGSSARTSRT